MKSGAYPKLSMVHYGLWNCNVRSALQAVDAWDIVTGAEGIPRVTKERFYEVRKNHQACVQRACSILWDSVSDSLQYHIMGNDDPEDIWEVLKNECDLASDLAAEINRTQRQRRLILTVIVIFLRIWRRLPPLGHTRYVERLLGNIMQWRRPVEFEHENGILRWIF
ncbi:hypothetical protein BZA77DRAFT_296979 [Pyronema omphalodes]|nr:hypothetical protein BZA77DRAFT_296979 [Pyronema omphalodes]